MSDFTTVSDAIIRELRDHIPKLTEAKVHRYEPWDPEVLAAQAGERHLAVWPVNEQTAEVANPLATGMHEMNQLYDILVWEGGAIEGERLVRDEQKTAEFYDLHDTILDRLYITKNQGLGGSLLLWYQATQLPQSAGLSRWFRIRLRVDRIRAFTP